jgi:hypothetical protein
MLLKRIAEIIPDLKIYVISDQSMEIIEPRAGAFYDPKLDVIAIRESAFEDPSKAFHFFLHEGAHALMYSALRTNLTLQDHMEDILDHVKDYASGNSLLRESQYGYGNIDEFLAEAWSNPQFQMQLAQIPVPITLWMGLPKPSNTVFRNVLNWLKAQLAKLVPEHNRLGSGARSAFDVAMDVGGSILESSTHTRTLYQEMMRASGVPSPIALIEDTPKSIGDRLRAAGLDSETATDLEGLIKDEFGGTVTDEELAALASEFKRPVTSQGDLDAKVAVTPPPGQPAVQDVIDRKSVV